MAGKADLASIVAKKMNISIANAEVAIENVFESILDLTDDGTKLMVRGFGTFVKKTSKARVARNPQTGEPISVPPKTKLTYKQLN